MGIAPVNEMEAIAREDNVAGVDVAMIDGWITSFKGGQDLAATTSGLGVAERPQSPQFRVKQLVRRRVSPEGDWRLHGPRMSVQEVKLAEESEGIGEQ
jgi:hypothetical protein